MGLLLPSSKRIRYCMWLDDHIPHPAIDKSTPLSGSAMAMRAVRHMARRLWVEELEVSMLICRDLAKWCGVASGL